MVYDIAIIGNGILAYSTAFELLSINNSLKIAIVGHPNRSVGATPAAGAMLGCFGEITTTTLQSSYGKEKLELSIRAADLWNNWLKKINEKNNNGAHARIQKGTYIIENAVSAPMEDKNYAAIIYGLKTYKQKYEEVSPSVIEGLNPLDNCRPMKALFLPDEGSIDPIHVLNNLHSAIAQSKNTGFITEDAAKIKKTKNNFLITTTKNEKISSTQIIVAAGVNSQHFIDQFPIKNAIPRLFSGVGNSIVTHQLPSKITHVIRTPNRSFSCGLHVLPQGENLYIGATNITFFDPQTQPNIGDIHFLLRCALQQINENFARGEILKINTGNRPVTIDTFPLIGRTSIDGLWILTGTNRDGFHFAPLFAKYIADKILNNTEFFSNKFLLERRPIVTLTKEAAIAETVDHYMAYAAEFPMIVPNSGWQAIIRDMFHTKIENIYNQLESDYIIPPNFIPIIDRNKQAMIPFFNSYYRQFE